MRDQLADRAIESFLPTIARWSRWKDRRKRIEWPLFPGYCFAKFDAAARMPVLTCEGVVAIVGVDGRPQPIPVQEIEDVRRLVDSELSFDPCPLIKEGTAVRVVHGPLTGVTGLLLRKGTHARLVLSVELIGRSVSVEVDAGDVEPE